MQDKPRNSSSNFRLLPNTATTRSVELEMCSLWGSSSVMADPEIDTNRLQFYERSYDQLMENDQLDETEELFAMILNSLHDNWSEIRKLSFKKLIKLRERFSSQVVATLLPVLLCFDGLAWQHLHGNLLGIRAVLPLVTSFELLTEIQLKLLETLSHPNLPIREVAAGSLLDLMKNNPLRLPDHLLFICQQIEPKARADATYHTENHSDFLYAALGLVSDLLMISPILNSEFTTSYLNIFGLCLLHNSTTVRIQATQTVKAMYDQSCPMFTLEIGNQEISACSPDSSIIDCLATIVETANHTISKANDWKQWRVLEGFLLIIEDILLRLSLSSSLLLSLTSPLPHPLLATFLSVIPPFRSSLHLLLSHPVFEIKRLLSQILPSLGRVCVLYSLRDPSSLLCSLLPVDCPPEVQHILELEIVKSFCLLLEALPSQPSAHLSPKPFEIQHPETNSFLSSLLTLSSAMAIPRWSSIIRRRLGEADRQKLFIQFISSPPIVTHLTSLFSPSAQQWVNSISLFCDHVFVAISDQISLGILSLDSIQLISYLLGLISSLSDSSASNDDFPLLLTSRKLFRLFLSFLLAFQSQIHQLPESLLSAFSHFQSEISPSWVCIDTLILGQRLTMKEQDEDGLLIEQTVFTDMTFTQFRNEKQISPAVFQRFLWALLTPLFPLLLNMRLTCYLLNGAQDNPSEVSSTSIELRAELSGFLHLIHLNSFVINNLQSITDIFWIGCSHITLLNLSLPMTESRDCLFSNFVEMLRKSQYFESLEVELRSVSNPSASKLDCQVISLIVMIAKFLSSSETSEKKHELCIETRNLRDLITARSTNEILKRGDEEEDEFSDWDESDDERNSADDIHSIYDPILTSLLGEYDLVFQMSLK
jgi:hypothetical protein